MPKCKLCVLLHATKQYADSSNSGVCSCCVDRNCNTTFCKASGRRPAGEPQTTHTQWGWVLPMQLSERRAAPYALASGGVLVFPGWLINHWVPLSCWGHPGSTGQGVEPRALCQQMLFQLSHCKKRRKKKTRAHSLWTRERSKEFKTTRENTVWSVFELLLIRLKNQGQATVPLHVGASGGTEAGSLWGSLLRRSPGRVSVMEDPRLDWERVGKCKYFIRPGQGIGSRRRNELSLSEQRSVGLLYVGLHS